MTTLICDCNRTMPLQARSLGAALNETLTQHSALCRREAGAFVQALQQGEPLVVACTQEQRLFGQLALQAGATAPIRFVNIRETGGWSRDAVQATPKMAALLAAAQLPEPEPVATVDYRSLGRVLVIGPLDLAERVALLLGDEFEVSVFLQGAGVHGASQERRCTVLGGQLQSLAGWLGAFVLHWKKDNPIDLDLCTRCNACRAVCPEGAISDNYQIDSVLCKSHKACVQVCQVAGAIDWNRTAQECEQTFDVVIDLRSQGAFSQHALPQGYVRWDGQDAAALLHVRSLIGEFEKPKFFAYRPALCAHSRNEKTGCTACVDVCSASAIASDVRNKQIKVQPQLCIGCGTCSTVCPSGAISYAYPGAPDQGVRMKTLLATYARQGGRDAVLLLHSQAQGARWLADLGRGAQLERHSADGLHGIPARVLPLALWHTSSVGLELWLSAVCFGAVQVWVLLTEEEPEPYAQALRAQMDVAQAVLTGLGYRGTHVRLLRLRDARDLPGLDADLRTEAAQGPARSASFAVQADKRATLELALQHLIEHAPHLPQQIDLPASGSPWGAVAVDRAACTLCLACVGACPAAALQDNVQLPQLRFIEKNCVQCGLCVRTCPEKALSLVPRLHLSTQRREPVVINEAQPYACVRCGKPFATHKAIEGMLGRLSGHAMFQGTALERLKMCADCRVIDIYSSRDEVRITDL